MLDQSEKNIILPKYELFFKPFWFFVYHQGLEKGVGVLDAVDTTVKINNVFLDNIYYTNTVDCEKLKEQQDFEYLDFKQIAPKITDEKEVEKIVNYKIPLLIDKKDILITGLELVYLPFWEITFESTKKKFVVNAVDKEYKKILKEYLKKQYAKPKTIEYVFADSLKPFKSPKSFFDELNDALMFLFKETFDFFKWLYKEHNLWFYVFILFLIVIIVLLSKFV